MLVCSDFNGHVRKPSSGFNWVHGGCAIKTIDLCAAANLAITNTYFMKPDSHLVTYRSGISSTQVGYIPTRHNDLNQNSEGKSDWR